MKITFLNFVLMSLAAFRITRLIVFDKITEFIRKPFFDEIEENENGVIELYYVPKKAGVKKFLGELLSCYWCTGIWTSAGLIIFHYFFPNIAGSLILIFAVAGIAAIIESIVQRIID